MKLKHVTVACIAIVGAPAALAQSALQIYGTLNGDVESVKADGGNSANFSSRTRVTSNSSNIGLRGGADLGQGLSTFFQIESAVNFDNGTSSGFLASRNSGLGLKSGYGQVLLGQWDSPYKVSTQRLDPTGDTSIAAYTGILGGTGTITAGQGGSNFAERASFDRRVSNVMQYWTPDWNGISARFAYGVGDTNIGSPAIGVPEGLGLKPALYSATLSYDASPWFATAAYEQHTDFEPLNILLNAAPSSGKDQAWKAGVQYSFPNNFSIGGIVEQLQYRADNINDLGSLERKVNNWYAIGRYQSGVHSFALSYGHKGKEMLSGAGFSDLPDSKAQQVTARYSYSLSKSAQLYAFATRISNQTNAFQNFGYAAITPTTLFLDPARGADPTGFGIGMIETF